MTPTSLHRSLMAPPTGPSACASDRVRHRPTAPGGRRSRSDVSAPRQTHEGALDAHPLRHHRDPVRQRAAAPRLRARAGAGRRARPPPPAARRRGPVPHRHRRQRAQERRRRPRPPASRWPRSWPARPTASRPCAGRCSCRTTTSSGPAPTRATPRREPAVARPAPPPATSTSATTQGLYCAGCEAFLVDELVDGRCPEHAAPPEPVVGAQLVLPALAPCRGRWPS